MKLMQNDGNTAAYYILWRYKRHVRKLILTACILIIALCTGSAWAQQNQEIDTPQNTEPPSGTLQSVFSVPSTIQGTYREGDTAEEIRLTKKLLNQTTCPIATDGLDADGEETKNLNQQTKQAVICYQTTEQIEPTGEITPQLYQNLKTNYTAHLVTLLQRLLNHLALFTVSI